MTKIFNLSNVTLLVALSLSTVAAYYSIIGLTAIFAGAVIPIIIMGSILEIGKITTTVWLRKYWKRCSLYLKFYLVPAVVLLAILTSMGIFGFLSKAHMDTGLVSGDVQAKLALIDEKIKTQRENIDISRKALQQMDAQVDARLSRGESEQGAERAVQIRRQQAVERTKLQRDIGDAQKEIAKLNEERAPIAAENRKVEAEVGPIKYIAALIYGDNTDQNMLEAAVRWVIILLVVVFDPLAIALVLAANASKEWDNKESAPALYTFENTEPPVQKEIKAYEADTGPLTDDQIQQIKESVMEHPNDQAHTTEEFFIEEKKEKEVIINETTHPYLYTKGKWFTNLEPVVSTKSETQVPNTEHPKTVVENSSKETIEYVVTPIETIEEAKNENIVTEISEAELEGFTQEYTVTELKDLGGGYVLYDGKSISKNALKELQPELFKMPTVDLSGTKFGKQFPRTANKGDMFIRIDVLPNKLFKFDGRRWFEVNKDTVDSYLDNEYIAFLISKIESGEYDIESMLDKEKDAISVYLEMQKINQDK